MFETLFPNWGNPATIATIVGLRVVLNGILTALTASAVGLKHTMTAVVAGLTLVSATIMIFALRPEALGQRASYVELLAQIIVCLVATYAVYTDPSLVRVAIMGGVLLGVTALLLIMIPLYGEALVAP